jgi:cell division protein FtsL
MIVEYGNLAYKLPEQYPKPAKKKKPQANRVRVKVVKRNREQMLSRSKNIRRICAIVAISLSAGFMISKFVAVNETNQEIASLQKQLTSLEAATSQMVFDMEQSVDLAEIEKEATTRLGMQRPEKYQTVYVNVKQDDMTEKTAGEVEGFGNKVLDGLKKIGGNIVQFFSIK